MPDKELEAHLKVLQMEMNAQLQSWWQWYRCMGNSGEHPNMAKMKVHKEKDNAQDNG